MADAIPVTLVAGTEGTGAFAPAPTPLAVVGELPVTPDLQAVLDDFEARIAALEGP